MPSNHVLKAKQNAPLFPKQLQHFDFLTFFFFCLFLVKEKQRIKNFYEVDE